MLSMGRAAVKSGSPAPVNLSGGTKVDSSRLIYQVQATMLAQHAGWRRIGRAKRDGTGGV